jgi:aspartyl/asparaginyl beta-hydroxylase (cupin superfamily)
MNLDLIDFERLEKESFSGMTPTPIEDEPSVPAERLALVKRMIADKKLPAGQNPYRRPALFYPGLPSVPIYDSQDFPWVQSVLSHVDDLSAELSALERERSGRTFHTVWPDFTIAGEWAAMWLRLYGELYRSNATLCPRTLAAIEGVPRQGGWLGFSAMAPRTHVSPHCGVTNAKLRCHLPIELRPGESRIRVHEQIYSWKKNEIFIFDDSFEHEVWNDSDARRVILIFDIFHPDLTADEVAFLEKVEGLTVKQTYNTLMEKYHNESSEVGWMYQET